MQQINLYQPLFRKQEKIFSAITMVQGAALVLAGMLLFFAYAAWQTSGLNRQATQAQQQRDQAAKQSDELARTMPPRSKNAALEQEVNRLRQELIVKQQVLSRLRDRAEGNTAGYAAHLEGLARQRLASLWLTGITIRQGGNNLELNGSALQPEQVPQFLQRLAEEPAFASAEYRYWTMTRPEKQPRQIDFTVMTEKAKK